MPPPTTSTSTFSDPCSEGKSGVDAVSTQSDSFFMKSHRFSMAARTDMRVDSHTSGMPASKRPDARDLNQPTRSDGPMMIQGLLSQAIGKGHFAGRLQFLDTRSRIFQPRFQAEFQGLQTCN